MSDIRIAIENYLELRRSLGFQLRAHGDLLSAFADYLDIQNASTITTRLALEWAQSRPELHLCTQAQHLSVVRGFARYYSAFDSATEIPPLGLLPGRYPRKAPYIYSDEQILQLMRAAKTVRGPKSVPAERILRPWTYHTMFGLFAVTGLRFGEVIRLERQDVDFERGLLTGSETKFGKTRLVPLHETTVQALRQYAERRDRIHPRPCCQRFFVAQRGGQLDMREVKTTFIQLSRQIGLRGANDSFGPRIHDFRHSLAVKTVLRWYRAGVDAARRMPVLSAFLGHAHVSDTYWYLSAHPELLAVAAERLEQFLEVPCETS